MKASIATVCIAGSLSEKLSAIARAGFDGIEIFENDLISSPLAPEEIRARVADLGLTIDLYQPFRDFEAVGPHQLERNLERARRKFDLMHRLGTDLILVCSNVATADAAHEAEMVDQLGRLADLAGAHDIRVAYEALAWGTLVSEYDHAWNLVSQVDHDSLGVCLDSFHILSRGTSLDAISTIPGEKIFFCQLADAPRMQMDVLSWSRHHRVFPGEGDWDLPDFVGRLLTSGYSGPLSLEVFNDVFRQSDPAHTARDARRSLRVLEDAIAQRHPHLPSLERLPERPDVTDFSFIELAPGPDDQLAEALRMLGFERRGRHRRKTVELWSQAEIRLVVNAERETDRPGLVGIGLDVPDVAAAAFRTATLLGRRLPRDQHPDEAVLEATVAPDGTEFSFASNQDSDDWDQEFPDARSQAPVLLGRVDHVALIQPWDRFDESVLFAESLLGLDPQSPHELASETGLVRSRALVNKDRSVRIAMNVSPASPVREGRYLNHVAFATDDALAVLTALRSAGMPMLPVPENYYDDLQARFGMSDDERDDLRDAGAMFDVDAQGAFIHAYTAPIGDLLFEIVERRDGYEGYGAVNAGLRMSSVRSLLMDRTR